MFLSAAALYSHKAVGGLVPADVFDLDFAAGADATALTAAGFAASLTGTNYSEIGLPLTNQLEISPTWGLVVNPAHINLMDSCDLFSGSNWNKVNTTATADIVGADPSGGNSADRIAEAATSSVHSVQAQNANTGVVGVKYCFSVCVKPETITRVKLYGALGVADALFLLTGNGSLISQTGTLRTFIYPIGNGWYRCGLVWNCTNTSVIPGVRALNASNADNYPGVVSNTMLLYRAGLEVEPYAPPALTTTTASVTVPAGTCIATRATISQGTVLLKGRTPQATGTTNTLFCLDDNTANNQVMLQWLATGGTLRLLVVSGGSTILTLDAATALAAGTDFKVIMRFGAADHALRYDWASPVSDTAAALPAGLSRERLGSQSAGAQWHGRIWRAERWSTKLSDTDMQAALDAA